MSTLRFQHCLVFLNPASTRAASAHKRIEELKHVLEGCEFEIVHTSPDGVEANIALVEKHASKLGKHTLIGIAAGDGTTSQIIEALIVSQHLSPEEKSTPILPLWGGNANDLAHMLNGPANRIDLRRIVEHGEIVPIHPLQCTMKRGRQRAKTRIAACYAGFGATAFAALKLNKPAHRQSRLHALPGGRMLQEFLTVASALLGAPSFAVKEADDIHIVYERTFANGSRMAKLKYLPVELTDEMFVINTLENKRLASAIPRLVELTQKKVASKFLRNYAYFTTQEKSWAHFDGEPMEIPANTEVHVQLSAQPFYALATTLHKK